MTIETFPPVNKPGFWCRLGLHSWKRMVFVKGPTTYQGRVCQRCFKQEGIDIHQVKEAGA